ncbi:MAG: methylenetetrahydrofolate reductase [NAD(P)H] [Armatimonadetes bacterium]|nr:methylenetetrahydrofolate reductase [NAD(P)H] [Armatimonadota bacterium]MBS1711469.1 methylenetetrahydrofolate reductase [NAD(P)H] [Armatimonadota bacterium]MBX3107606.1 methylenetetrahydrofolate reductase [NAD(P)H] [Fimbriimonadaceae bacterium]
MRICDGFGAGNPGFSFEFFPPKTGNGEKNLFESIGQLARLSPHFVSVTCGAGGSTRRKTVDWAEKIRNEHALEPMVHLTCLGVPEKEIRDTLEDVKTRGLLNILALRGDAPVDGSPAEPGFCNFAAELVGLIRKEVPNACVAAACYPEKHTEAVSKQADLDALRAKADEGVDFFITQLFFDNDKYFEFVGRARSVGVTQPIIPGIMPIQGVAQVRRFTEMCGATIPSHLLKLLDQYEGAPAAVYHIGIAHAIAQCTELLAAGVPGIHFYTLNKSPATRVVVEALRG